MSENKTLTVVDSIRKQEAEFAALLKASGTDIKKFMNNAIMAVNDKPEIKSGEVSTKSVFAVCSRAANDGVVLDNREAAMVLGWNSQTRQKEAQYRLMAAGVMKMIRRSPEIAYIACQVVYENDICTIDFVTDEIPVHHTIDLKKGRGDPIGAYVVAKLVSGEWTSPEYMSKSEIEHVRDNFVQRNKEGKIVSPMWLKAETEAWRKTVLHRAKKRLPIGDKEQEVLTQDEKDLSGGEFIEHEPTATAETSVTPDKRQTRAAKAVKAAVQPAHDDDGVIDVEAEDTPAPTTVVQPAEIDEEQIPI